MGWLEVDPNSFKEPTGSSGSRGFCCSMLLDVSSLLLHFKQSRSIKVPEYQEQILRKIGLELIAQQADAERMIGWTYEFSICDHTGIT